ncbi:adenylosuccinate synthetase, partial [Pseudomonas aeruginosa]
LNASTYTDRYIGLQPVHGEMPGWNEAAVGAKTLEELPANALAYIKSVEQLVGAAIVIITTGPDGNQNIILRHPFA